VALAGDELLPAIDVVSRAGGGSLIMMWTAHVGWTDNPPNGKSGAELIAARVDIIA